MSVTIEPHNPAWLEEFLRTQDELKQILCSVEIVSIEHVGSTSIPGLVAKPVIDIDIVVKPENLVAVRQALVRAVPPYQDLGEMGVPGRVAFRPPSTNPANTSGGLDERNAKPSIKKNIYVILEGCLSLRNHLDLRRMLLQDPHLRDEYGDVKEAIVGRGVSDVDEYCHGKNQIMLKILRRAGWSEDDLEEVKKANE